MKIPNWTETVNDWADNPSHDERKISVTGWQYMLIVSLLAIAQEIANLRNILDERLRLLK